VRAGILKSGTPLCFVKKATEFTPASIMMIGRVGSIEKESKPVQEAKVGDEVCIKVEQGMSQNYIMYGRHFDHHNMLISALSRRSIDLLKENFRDDLSREDWVLVVKLKKLQGIE
jgi:translation initiation factor 5B